MIQTKEISEASIKTALSQGYITKNEARHMLKMYLSYSNFRPFFKLI